MQNRRESEERAGGGRLRLRIIVAMQGGNRGERPVFTSARTCARRFSSSVPVLYEAEVKRCERSLKVPIKPVSISPVCFCHRALRLRVGEEELEQGGTGGKEKDTRAGYPAVSPFGTVCAPAYPSLHPPLARDKRRHPSLGRRALKALS